MSRCNANPVCRAKEGLPETLVGTRKELIPPRNAEELPDNRVTLFFPAVSTETQTQRGECCPVRAAECGACALAPAALQTAGRPMGQ